MKNKHSFIDDYFPKKTKTHQDTEDLGLISVSLNQRLVAYEESNLDFTQTPLFTSTASDANFVLSSIGEESCSNSSAESSITELPTDISHSINQSTLNISIPKESAEQIDFPNIYSADQWFEKLLHTLG
ncbi:hypothetical protein LOD99_1487 [Oopsacas minuta]|uniref:Uncharacterized protein n=1 Tax=Oopsacas minuta TaxID=111878 RepID=A0AAV7K5V3_9METZ|nr:hypothetical protein LOD99_1487 [Oopsacas minuta]